MFPVMLRIESLDPGIRNKTEHMHLLMLLPHGTTNYDVYLAPAVKELRLAATEGIKLVGASVGFRSRCFLMCVSGDLRAIPGLIGRFRDPKLE